MRDYCIGVWLIVLSYYDQKEKRIPVYPVAVGGGFAILCIAKDIIVTKESTVIGLAGVLPGVVLLLLTCFTDQVGTGDGMIVGILGLCKGMRSCMIITCIALLLFSVVGILLLLLRRVKKDTQLPFLPFLCAAFWLWKTMLT